MRQFIARWKDSLPYTWFYYLLTVVLAVALWTAAFTLRHTPKRNESLYLFFAGDVTDAAVKNELLHDLAPNGVKAVHLSSIHPDDPAFYAKYDALGLNRCDVLILPEDVAAATLCRDAFLTADGSAGELFTQEGVPYGYYLPDGAKNALSSYFDLSTCRYVVLVAAASPHGGGDCPTDNAWRLVRQLLTYDEISQ